MIGKLVINQCNTSLIGKCNCIKLLPYGIVTDVQYDDSDHHERRFVVSSLTNASKGTIIAQVDIIDETEFCITVNGIWLE